MLSHFLGHLQRATMTERNLSDAPNLIFFFFFVDLLSPHVEEPLADLLVLLLHAQLSRFALWGQLGEQEVTIFFEKTHPAQVLHTLAGSKTTRDISREGDNGSTTTRVQRILSYCEGTRLACLHSTMTWKMCFDCFDDENACVK